MPDRARAVPDAWRLALLAVALLVLRGALDRAAGLDLHFDEAQYWEWSQRLDWSYYSKGPLVAWLIALSTAVLGHGEWQVRLFAWIAFDALLILLFLFARDVWASRRAGWWAVALGLTTPLFVGLGHLMTTDVLLLGCWTWGLWAAYRAVHRGERRAWYECGIAVGLGALTKLTILLLPAFLALAMILTRTSRDGPRRAPPLGAGALMLAILSPVVLWNAGHDWVMFRHNQGHVGGFDLRTGNTLEFLLGQWLLLSPVVAYLAARSLAAVPRAAAHRLLWALSLGVLGVFILRSVTGKAQANWAAPAYVGFLVLFAGDVDGLPVSRRRLLVAGMGLSAALTLAAWFPHILGLPSGLTRELKAWRQPIRAMARQAPQAEFILTTSYHKAGELSFYWPRPLPVYVIGPGARRHGQHDLWPGPEQEAGRTGLFVDTWPTPPAELSRAFAGCEPLHPVPGVAAGGELVRVFYSQLCRGYRSIPWPRPRGY